MAVADDRLGGSWFRPIYAAIGLSCPICFLAVLLSVSLAGISVGAIFIDLVRSRQQADATVENVYNIAFRRTIDLVKLIDADLRAIEDAAGDLNDPGRSDRINRAAAERRDVEPRVIGLLLLNTSGSVIGGQSGGLGSAALLQACGTVRADSDQTVLRSTTVVASGQDSSSRILCALRRVNRSGFSGISLAVLSYDVLREAYIDLIVWPRGVVSLTDDSGQLVARVSPLLNAGPAGLAPSIPRLPERAADLRGLLNFPAPDPEREGKKRAGRIDRPIPVMLEVKVPDEDLMAGWWARMELLASSALIVISFIALGVLAVRRCEQREAKRLERLAEVSGELAGTTDRAVLTHRMIEAAQELVPCTSMPAPIASGSGAAGDRALGLSIVRPDLVRVGATVLQRTHGGSFSTGELAFLRVLARVTDGEIRHAVSVNEAGRDVERARDIASQSRRAVETVLQETSDAVFSLDGQWRIVDANRNADQIFGEPSQKLYGRVIWQVFPELAGTVFETDCRSAIRDGLPGEFDLQWLRTENWLRVRAFPRAPGLVVYMQDISHQIDTDDRLRQVQKMDAIGRLTGGIAHDFNNLLTVILGGIENLQLDLPETSDLHDISEQIRRAAASAAELTHQLLAFARRQPLSPADVDIADLISTQDTLLRRSLGPSVNLEIRNPPGLWHARVDRTQLQNAVINLAINARDAMPSGGRLTIETHNFTNHRLDKDAFGEIKPGNYVVISVSDTGIGIPKNELLKVFEPFFTTKSAGRGTGLGLAMVHGFVTQSGGHVRITSEVGRGTTLRLFLPALSPADQTAGVPLGLARKAAIVLPGGREKILVVEDTEMVRDFVRGALTNLGYDVAVAKEGREALVLLDQGLMPDLLLTDILLPNGMDGFAVAEQVTQRRPGIPVLYMSGFIEDADHHQSLLDKETNLLQKPFPRARLAAMVRARLDQRPG